MKILDYIKAHDKLCLYEHKKWSMCCPFHQEHTPSFTFNHQFYHCFGCGAHGETDDLYVIVDNDKIKIDDICND